MNASLEIPHFGYQDEVCICMYVCINICIYCMYVCMNTPLLVIIVNRKRFLHIILTVRCIYHIYLSIYLCKHRHPYIHIKSPHIQIIMDELVKLREVLKAGAEAQGIRLTYLPLFVKVSRSTSTSCNSSSGGSRS